MNGGRIDKDHWLITKPVAHRGLWGGSVLENSLTAYERAARAGYPFEIDLYLSTDGVLYCFHDKTLDRMTGEKGNIFDKDSAYIDGLRLIGSDERIPRFTEVLELAEGRVPLLIELKDHTAPDFVEKAVNLLKNYKGEFAVQTFNPKYLIKVKKLAPEFIRGILATDDAKEESLINQYILKHMSLNFIAKPDFISYRYPALPLKMRKAKGMPTLGWTVTSQEDATRLKSLGINIIFENFIPE